MIDTKRLRELLAVATFYQYKEDLNERVRRERATEDVLRLAPALLDEVERLRAENEAHTKWVQSAEQNFHSLEGKIDRLKGLIYLYGLVPRGKTVDAGKWEEIQKMLGEG